MAAVLGVDLLVLVDIGTAGTPDFQPVAGQRGATLTRTRATIDVTSKDSPNLMDEYEAGRGTWTISADGVYVENDTAYAHLVTAWQGRQKVRLRWSEGGTAVFEGDAIITSASLEGPYDAEATYSLEFQGSGEPTPVA